MAGTAIVAVPDSGPRVFALSEGHGPSVWDLVGVTILLVGWACLLVPLFRARSLIPAPCLFLGVVLLGLAVVVFSVAGDVGAWWVAGVLMAVGAQLGAALVVGRVDGHQRSADA
ncbi:hypothetical protein JNB_07904 [Janibacter sp. HTCC2649]|nr:hypothetical protein JNB_07904 [Janibacter sp. HTCC2649]